jgi:hypothetical protein
MGAESAVLAVETLVSLDSSFTSILSSWDRVVGAPNVSEKKECGISAGYSVPAQ